MGRKFKMGSPALWEHHKRNYNKNHDLPLPEANLKKPKANNVTVVKTDTSGKKKKKT